MIDFVGRLVRVTCAALYPGGVTGQQVEEFNIGFRCATAGGGDSTPGLATAVTGLLQGTLGPRMAASTEVYGVKVATVGIYPPPLAAVTNTPVAGGGTDPTLPTQVRGLVRWKTTTGGRKGRGRCYIWTPMDADLTATGNPSSGYQAAITAFANGYGAGITVSGSVWQPALLHRGAGPSPPYTSTDIVNFEVLGSWCTQRRSGESGRPNTPPW